MTEEIQDKLVKIVRYCSEKQIQLTFAQDPTKKNSIELVDNSIVKIQLANYEEGIDDMLEDFLTKLKNSF